MYLHVVPVHESCDACLCVHVVPLSLPSPHTHTNHPTSPHTGQGALPTQQQHQVQSAIAAWLLFADLDTLPQLLPNFLTRALQPTHQQPTQQHRGGWPAGGPTVQQLLQGPAAPLRCLLQVDAPAVLEVGDFVFGGCCLLLLVGFCFCVWLFVGMATWHTCCLWDTVTCVCFVPQHVCRTPHTRNTSHTDSPQHPHHMGLYGI